MIIRTVNIAFLFKFSVLIQFPLDKNTVVRTWYVVSGNLIITAILLDQ